MSTIQEGRLRASNEMRQARIERAAANMPNIDKLTAEKFAQLDIAQRQVLKAQNPERYAELAEEAIDR